MIYFPVCLVTTKREGAATRLQERLHRGQESQFLCRHQLGRSGWQENQSPIQPQCGKLTLC